MTLSCVCVPLECELCEGTGLEELTVKVTQLLSGGATCQQGRPQPSPCEVSLAPRPTPGLAGLSCGLPDKVTEEKRLSQQ